MQIKEVYFKIETDYDKTNYEPLFKLAVTRNWDTNIKKNVWMFRLEGLNQVISILGKPLETNKETEIMSLVNICPPLKVKISTTKWKGISGLQITKQEKVYEISEWRKDNNGTPKEMKHEIPIENVIIAWEVIKKQELDEWVKSKTVSEHICRLLGLQRFFRETGSFSWEKFLGSRKEYYNHFYLCIKVLEFYKVIEYHKKGKIKRIGEWSLQEQFNNEIK